MHESNIGYNLIMKENLHVVLGGAGAIGTAVINELLNKKLKVKAIERTKNVDGVETYHTNLLDHSQTMTALDDASHIYVCVGLPYKSVVWESDWPKLMGNVIAAAAKNNAKIIFFDNIYMYGPPPLKVPFDENHSQEPVTRKGRVRKQTADLVLKAHRDEKIQALIARSADFYGHRAVNSPFYIQFLERMLTGKAPQSLSKRGIKHTFAYTMDNAQAIVRLALDETSYGEVWHLPVGDPITFDDVLDMMNKTMQTSFTVQYTPKPLLHVLPLFIPPVKEVKEMLYQFNQPYIMSWDKLRKKYPDITPTPYAEGIKTMIESFRNI